MIKYILIKKIYFPVVLILSISISILTVKIDFESSHNAYWEAIYRVQTVDFNILASVLTETGKEIIKTRDINKANEVVNSNYCLFRIVISECKNDCSQLETIADNTNSTQSEKCKYLTKNTDKDPFRIPIYDEDISLRSLSFKHAYNKQPEIKTSNNLPIGYIDAYRGSSPTVFEDFISFMDLWLDGKANASRHGSYKTNIILGITVFVALIFLSLVIRLFAMDYYKTKKLTQKMLLILDKKIKGTQQHD